MIYIIRELFSIRSRQDAMARVSVTNGTSQFFLNNRGYYCNFYLNYYVSFAGEIELIFLINIIKTIDLRKFHPLQSQRRINHR